MAMEVKIHKKLGEYELDVHWKSTKKRIGILGASGSGKSLTLKSIAGIEHPDQGHIQIGDHVLYDSDSRICLKPQKRNVGYMFQNYALFPTMTVEQNVGAGLAGNKKKKPGTGTEDDPSFPPGGTGKKTSERAFRRAAAESCAGEDHGIRTIRYSSR